MTKGMLTKEFIEQLILELKNHIEQIKLKSTPREYIYNNALSCGLCLYILRKHGRQIYDEGVFNKYVDVNGTSTIDNMDIHEYENPIDGIQVRIEVLSEMLVNEEYQK